MTLSLAADNIGQNLTAEEFVSRIYFHGLPLEQTVQYSSADTVRLFAMLNDESYIQYHENIALTIGMIGDSTAVPKLIAYVDNGMGNDGETIRAQFKGRVGAVIGLGYSLNRTGSELALNYLSDRARANTRFQHSQRTEGSSRSNDRQMTQDLRKYAIIGLGLSGDDAAKEHLRELQIQAVTTTGNASPDASNNTVGQSLDILETISTKGLLEYYRRDAH